MLGNNAGPGPLLTRTGLATLCALTLGLFGCARAGRDLREAAAAELFSEWNRSNSPGCAAGVIQNGRFLLQLGVGSADLDRREPIGPDTVFNLASMSKQFTGMAVALLIGDGKLPLDDDVRKYVPELPDYGEPVRIRDLVYHTSGFRDYISLTEDLSDFGRLDKRHTEAEFLDLLVRQKALNFAPGARFSYNNSNYFLLGIIVKRVTHMSLRTFGQDRIFGPLGMQRTHFADRLDEAVQDRAAGYEDSGSGRFTRVQNHLEGSGDGGVLTTLNDLVRWDAEFYGASLGGPALHALLVTPGALREGTPLNYGFGLYQNSTPIGTRIHHGGNDAGFRTRMARYPSARLSIFCLCNSSSISTGQIVDKLAGLYLGSGATAHVAKVPVKAAELARSQGHFRDSSTMGIWSFRLAGDGLIAALVGIPGEKKLVSTGHGVFSTEDGSFVATFDSAAETVQISEYHSPPTAFSRVRLATPRDMNEYAGTYITDELPARYRLEVANGKLAVMTPKVAAGHLLPTIVDAFTGTGNYFLFHRNASGVVAGFRLGENTGT